MALLTTPLVSEDVEYTIITRESEDGYAIIAVENNGRKNLKCIIIEPRGDYIERFRLDSYERSRWYFEPDEEYEVRCK